MRIYRKPVAFALLAALATAVLLASPPASAQGDEHRADAVLAEFETIAVLSVFAGVGPTRCVESAPGVTLCEWELGNRHSGWKAVAKALDTVDRVRLLCELPESGAPRAPSSCTAHRMRSERRRWSVPVTAYQRDKMREAKRRQAVGEIETARTLVELSRFIGATPHMCAPQPPDEQVCLWRATARNHGHGVLAASIGAPLNKKVRMHCVLPDDGSARRWESCTVEVGS